MKNDVKIVLKALEEKGIMVQDGLDYTGSPERYLAAVQRYVKAYGENRATVEKLLSEKDLEEYAIRVHALKSNSRTLGARSLGKMFEQLELASKNGDEAYLIKSTLPALENYKKLVELLQPVCETEPEPQIQELSLEEARKTAKELLEALDDFDDDLSKELANRLLGYPFDDIQKEKLNMALHYIEDFLYDEAAELVDQISETMEQAVS